VITFRDRWRSMVDTVRETRQLLADVQSIVVTRLDESAQNEAAARARLLEAMDADRARLLEAVGTSSTGLARLLEANDVRTREILRVIADQDSLQRQRLYDLRSSDTYLAAFDDPEPLVSVVIPTFDRARLLVERSIPSVLAQTYQNFEVIVVGDAASDRVREAVEGFGDERIRFTNLDYRGPYPDDEIARW
jgi:hypothetical protein